MRNLTDRESAVLAHVVLDASGWWAHARQAPNLPDPERALINKVARWGRDYDTALRVQGGGYQARAAREV